MKTILSTLAIALLCGCKPQSQPPAPVVTSWEYKSEAFPLTGNITAAPEMKLGGGSWEVCGQCVDSAPEKLIVIFRRPSETDKMIRQMQQLHGD